MRKILLDFSPICGNLPKEGLWEEAEIIKQISPTAWQHVNFMGRYDFTEAAEEINIPGIIKEIRFIPLSQPEIPC